MQDLRGEIAKVAKFLGKELTEEQLDRLREHLRFENLQKNEAVNNEFGKKMGVMNTEGRFMRKGNYPCNFIIYYDLISILIRL